LPIFVPIVVNSNHGFSLLQSANGELAEDGIAFGHKGSAHFGVRLFFESVSFDILLDFSQSVVFGDDGLFP
jgi:hypothetical protein